MPQSIGDRVEAAIRLLHRAVARDDQQAFDFLLDVVEANELYLHMRMNDGTKITRMQQVRDDLWALAKELGTAEE